MGGRRYPRLPADVVRSRIGAEHDPAVTVGSAGFAFANGGLSWIVPKASLVIVKLSSLPRPLEPAVTRDHHRAFHALTSALAAGRLPG